VCVAYPMKVAALVAPDRAQVSLGDVQAEVSIELLDEVREGDYVIVHAGFAIQKLSVEEAEETIRLLEAMVAGADARGSGATGPSGET
jgi:hydrogenase expression/formation protein HypC